ncbi:MAG: helix-turn-helix domain-containing protein, partial [Anaerolineae bacterium]
VAVEPAGPSAEEIFRQIGRELRQRRELLSLTLEEVERHVHIRVAFLQALEEGADDRLPAPVQTRGMLANYAMFLDLNADVLLLRYAEALQIRHRQRHPYRFRPRQGLAPLRPNPSLLRSFIAGDLLFGLGMVALLGALAVWGVGRLFAASAGESPLPTAPSIPQVLAEMVAPTITQEVTLIPAADTPLPTLETPLATLETPGPPANVNVMVNIVALERTFMRVFVDGKIAFEGRVRPGSVYPFEALSQVAVLTGNGAALRVTYNGQDMGLLGGVGDVVNVLFTVSGVMTPTLTPSPTATLTPVVTPSRTPTITSTPSATRTPSPTPTIRP